MAASNNPSDPGAPRPAARRRLDVALSLLVFFIALLAYLRTMRPTFGWGDSSELITAAYHLGVGHPPGCPTWMLLAYPFAHLPIGDVAFRVNLMNALLGALAIPLLYLVYTAISRSRTAGVVAALAFAFSATFWDITTEADVFTLHVCFAALILLLALRWRRTREDRWLYLMSAVVGVSLGNHALIGLMAPALLYLVWAERGGRFFLHRRTLACIGCLVVGLSVYAYLPIRSLSDPPPHVNNVHSLNQFWIQVTAPGARHAMFDDGALIAFQRAAQYLYRLTDEFGLAGCALALFGLGLLWRRDRVLATFLVVLVVVDVFYACNFSIFDIYTYYLPLHIVWGALLALGAASALRLAMRAIEAVRQGTGSLTPRQQHALVAAFLLCIPFALFTAHLRLVDGSDDWGSEWFARAVFGQIEQGSVVLADWWTIAPLGYLKYVEGERDDVVMYAAPSMYACDEGGMEDFLKHGFIERFPAVYFVEMLTYESNLVRERCYLVPEGPVARVLADRPAPETVLADMPARPVTSFGDRVGLVATEVEAAELRPGECLDFTLYWTALDGYPGRPHQAILMLESDERERIWQESNLLGHDLYPQDEWAPGQVLIERHRIYLSRPVPTGTYDLLVRVREHGQSRCLTPDLPASADDTRDYRIATIEVRDPDGASSRSRLPAVVALLRP